MQMYTQAYVFFLQLPEIEQWILKTWCMLNSTDTLRRQFSAITGFTNVIDTINCTLIAIKASVENELAFNDFHFHSISVQVIAPIQM